MVSKKQRKRHNRPDPPKPLAPARDAEPIELMIVAWMLITMTTLVITVAAAGLKWWVDPAENAQLATWGQLMSGVAILLSGATLLMTGLVYSVAKVRPPSVISGAAAVIGVAAGLVWLV